MRKARVASFVRVGCLALSLAQAASAQNLVENGDFATDVDGWDDVDTEVWFDDDVAGNLASGSMLVTNASAPQTGTYARQCIPVAAGETYTFGASHFSEGAETTGLARVDLRFWGTQSCTSDDGTLHRIEAPDTGAWLALEGVATAPAEAVAASLSLVAFKSTGQLSAPWTVAFDDVFVVVPEPSSLAAATGWLPKSH